jgi:uncharacterized protein YkwD
MNRRIVSVTGSLVCTFLFCCAASNAQSVPASTGSRVLQSQAQQALDFHNLKRHEVGVAPLEWSAQLSVVAQDWANHLVAAGCGLQHTQHSQFGENLFGGSGMPFSALDAAKDWYTEAAQFKYAPLTASNFAATGHYTQMVWGHSTQLGMGQATCSDGTTIIVAEYNPPGNYIGQTPYQASTPLTEGQLTQGGK